MHSFGKSIARLATGAVIVQVIPFLITPLLTRLYVPDAFASAAVFLSTVSILGTIVNGRYENAIMHSVNADEAKEILYLSLSVGLGFSLLISMVFWAFGDSAVLVFGHPELKSFIKIVGVPLCWTGVVQSVIMYLTWQKKFTTISMTRVIQSAAIASFGIIFGFLKYEKGLIVAQIIGLFFSAMMLLFLDFPKRLLKIKTLLDTAKKFSRYPLHSAPAALLDSASQFVCIFVLGKFYSNFILGQFSLTHRLLLAPMALIGVSVSQAFFQQASELDRGNQSIYALMVETSKKLFFYSLPIFAVLILFAPWFFELLFGAKWRLAGEFTQLIALGYWFRLAVSPISTIFMVVHRIKVGTLWQAGYFVSSCAVLGVLGWLKIEVKTFFIIYGLHEACLYTLYFLLAKKVCIEHEAQKKLGAV